jgi:hypothetical protein
VPLNLFPNGSQWRKWRHYVNGCSHCSYLWLPFSY